MPGNVNRKSRQGSLARELGFHTTRQTKTLVTISCEGIGIASEKQTRKQARVPTEEGTTKFRQGSRGHSGAMPVALTVIRF